MNEYKLPFEFTTGLGYSPSGGPPVGGALYTPGTGFFGQSIESILPNGSNPTSDLHFFGKPRKVRHNKNKNKNKNTNKNKNRSITRRLKRRSIRQFGNYPLTNLPDNNIDMQIFPKTPIGPGNTSGGDGGNWFPSLPSTGQFWGFGNRKCKKCKSRKYKKYKSRKSYAPIHKKRLGK